MEEGEFNYVAYRLIGDEQHEVYEFACLTSMAEAMDKSIGTIRKALNGNHRVRRASGSDETWFVFKGNSRINYIQQIIERRI